MVIKVFLDASVIIATMLSSSGGSSKILTLAKKKKITAIISQTVVAEVLDHKAKLKLEDKGVCDFFIGQKIIVREEITAEEAKQYNHLINSDDAHLVAGAKLTGCDYLVSLDKKHVLSVADKFLPLKICDTKGFLRHFSI